jgi:short-subunit dehydrogenase
MAIELKPIDQQVMVITGASSGIGLCTAQSAAQAGAKVVLASRSDQTLSTIVDEINAAGGEAFYVPCDVSNREDLERVARETINRFGRIDTWVNNAGLAIYGRLTESSDDDNRRLFDVNYWGVVYGSLVALPHLTNGGGALINVGSEVSEAAVPLLGMYVASKHAVKGFTDCLRIEVEQLDKSPVSITLIQPTATDTPFPQHARNYMDTEPKLPAPIQDPQKVADAIISAAQKPTRAIKVGMMAKMNVATSKLMPGVAEKMAAKRVDQLHTDEPSERDPEGALYIPSEDGNVHGHRPGANA